MHDPGTQNMESARLNKLTDTSRVIEIDMPDRIEHIIVGKSGIVFQRYFDENTFCNSGRFIENFSRVFDMFQDMGKDRKVECLIPKWATVAVKTVNLTIGYLLLLGGADCAWGNFYTGKL